MADQVLETLRDLTEGQIDFQGQKFAEFLATALLSVTGALSFIYGYLRQDIKLALSIGLAGTGLTFLLVVPPWPFLNRHPLKWLPVGGVEKEPQEVMVDGEVVG